MGDNNESIFCWEREEEYGYGYTYQEFQNFNHCFETANQTTNGEASGSKRMRLSSDSDGHQEGDESNSSESRPLGLKLSRTPSFLDLLRRMIKGKHTADFSTSEDADDDEPTKKMDEYYMVSQSNSEKMKASNFPALYIKIGSWERVTRHEGDLTAKLYYAKKKLVWEILEGALKSKLEIQWSDISAIRALTPENEPGTLEIELSQAPMFHREINPQPRKHTLWQQSSDFTGGQAPLFRRHYVRFPPGMLDKHYEKLLQCDERLFLLSQKPFPSHESPYFNPNMFGASQFSLAFNNYGSTYQNPRQAYPRESSLTQAYPRESSLTQAYPRESSFTQAYPRESSLTRAYPRESSFTQAYPRESSLAQAYPRESSLTQLPTSTMLPVMDFPTTNYGIGGSSSWTQHHYQPNAGLVNDIQPHYLGESHVASSNESLYSLLDPTNAHHYYTTDHQGSHNINVATDFINPNIAQPHYWMPHHQYTNDDDTTLLMEQQMSNNNSFSSFLLPGMNPTNYSSGDHYYF